MQKSILKSMMNNFLGNAPNWYKYTIIIFLLINPVLLKVLGPFITGWIIMIQFIFTLSMALKCYPLPAGGLIALEAIILNMTSPKTVYKEVVVNFPLILLMIFMVAGIYFMKEGLLFIFSKVLIKVKSKLYLSLLFSFFAALLSAFLDALTVMAVIIAVIYGFYQIYHKVVSESHTDKEFDLSDDSQFKDNLKKDLENFRGFLRNLLMHGAIGTALGGATTLVGEPQNLLIGKIVGWDFLDFFIHTAPVSIPVLITGLITCIILEKFKIFGYHYEIPQSVRTILEKYKEEQNLMSDNKYKARLLTQGFIGIILIISLAFHIAEIGLIGLMIIVLLTAFTGIIDEHKIGNAFTEALPFTALLVVFFAIVAIIHDQNLFTPITKLVIGLDGNTQKVAYFTANGILSMISDNVFVATVYASETLEAFKAGLISKAQFEKLAVAINMGTNIPSIATPNGQAAFLFLLTSAVAPLIRLSYFEMIKLAIPYFFTMTTAGLIGMYFL
ncbi:sodium/proton antiporter NhaB [Deferribacter autotrophicus]|uniref:Sodium/proton antiporter NhaB n=1 Tax=Deferribacter autotrophicus TaxID=500465 RepID=A0A5A8F5R1_9BACT|nr:sodium/proton antiporter NhaB [Deferribacter autotrophicus]KAA0259466.1 sodium/proton antiporter NhaB [Deferribacter autotrophicus]